MEARLCWGQSMRTEQNSEAERYKKPTLIAEVRLYGESEGRNAKIIRQGDLNECYAELDGEFHRQTAWLQLGLEEFKPGETRTVGFHFLSENKAVSVFKRNGKFFIGSATPIGEAKIVCW